MKHLMIKIGVICMITLLLISKPALADPASIDDGTFGISVDSTEPSAPDDPTPYHSGTFGFEVDVPANIPTYMNNGTFGISLNVTEPEVVLDIPNIVSSGTFGIQILQPTVIIDVEPDDWDADNPDVGTSVTNNFTFYHNGSATINVRLGFNTTNYTYADYSTWNSNGHDQYTANFTTDNWGSETNIGVLVGGEPDTLINTSMDGGSSFTFGIRLYMPKTVTYSSLKEDFEIWFKTNTI
jgi:hypothetical protein